MVATAAPKEATELLTQAQISEMLQQLQQREEKLLSDGKRLREEVVREKAAAARLRRLQGGCSSSPSELKEAKGIIDLEEAKVVFWLC